MQINLTGHHVDVTDSLRDYVNGKFEKLERHFDHINNVHVVLTVEKLNQIAESTVHLSGTEVHAKAENNDLIDKLDRQILKYKGKINKH